MTTHDLTQQKKSTQTPQAHQIILDRSEILRDYSLAWQSREASVIGRREVLSGKAKFGIFGDGKEVPQIALAKAFQKGDWRSGYYRDQTLMLALNAITLQQFFAQLYAHADPIQEPHSAGRQMNAHFATRSLNPDGSWKDLTQQVNSSPDVSPTGGQMPRLVGLGHASTIFRHVQQLHDLAHLSRNGNEVVFGTIGNASCAEGMFWEALNAIGVLQSPVVLSIWDDEYGISVANKHQITGGDLSSLLQGFQRQPGNTQGFDIYTVKGWDYYALVQTYQQAARSAREQHIPAIVHVVELTQPQGHSTSGSHERYKSAERLAWEKDHDCLTKMREWLIEQHIAPAGELDQIERNAKKLAENARTKAWKGFALPVFREREQVGKMIQAIEAESAFAQELHKIRHSMLDKQAPYRKDIMATALQVLTLTRTETIAAREALMRWRQEETAVNKKKYATHLHSESDQSPLKAPEIKPIWPAKPTHLKGYEVLNKAFDAILARDPRVVTFGEDVGKLGGVNQTMAGMQAKYGDLRVADTGIRETTILGQAIGLALRGLRPIAEIQYLDYILYALQTMSDDLATVHWRSAGAQKAPVIVRTRGHRLEGIWHAGSPMAGIIHLVRGMHVVVPRNMVQAAGFYNTLIQGDDPALIIEVLNGYRLREPVPDNLTDFTVPLGVPEVLRAGEDITIVTYGACVQVALETAVQLEQVGIDTEVIDVQTLLPFDRYGRILESLKKTSRILFLDEDVPGGATAFMMQEVIEKQGGHWWLDAEPRTLSAAAHRPSFGSDGNYFSKPNVEDVFTAVYEMMHEAEPGSYPIFYR